MTTHNPSSTVKSISYTVRNGDSLSSIASKYRVGVKDLHRWNTIKGKYIQPGQRLKLYIDVTEQSGSQS
jgi:membrane-bound lytic murein transglycosylase D